MATSVAVYGAPTIVPAQQIHMQPQQVQPQQPPRNLSSIKGLAVTQLVIGIFTVILGIAAVARLYANTWTTNTGAGIWAGGWIAVTGIIGICSSRNYTSNSLNGVYMAFNIISTCASALAGLFFIVAVAFYAVFHDGCYIRHLGFFRGTDIDCDYKSAGLGIHVPLLILMIVEFFVSIVAAVFCCQNGCGRSMQTGIIVQQAQPVMMVPAGNTPGYPATMQYTHVPQYGMQAHQPYNQVPPAYNAQPPPPAGVNQPPSAAYPDKPPDYR